MQEAEVENHPTRPEAEWQEKDLKSRHKTIHPFSRVISAPNEYTIWDDLKFATFELPDDKLFLVTESIEEPRVQKLRSRFVEKRWFSLRAKWYLTYKFVQTFRNELALEYFNKI